MPYASYQQPNDYSLVKEMRPFDLPYQSLMQEISTKQEYWKLGADMVKSAYEQAAGLSPQYAEGKAYLRNFMSEASKKLESVSKSDLSIMDNSQQAVSIFKPLFNTNNPFNLKVLKDSELNSFYKRQQQLSDSYRTKDGGKQWNINNETYFRDAQAKYLEDAKKGDYSTIDYNYQNRKSFIPYYDYKKEITDIQEACKGFSSEMQTPDSNDKGYFYNESYKGCSPEQLAYAFQTGLSDAARQQIGIDGYIRYRGNEDALATRFTDNMINKPKEEIEKLQAKISGLQAGKQDSKTKELISNLEERLKTRQKSYEANLKEYNTMIGGDVLKYVKNNFDNLSSKVYFTELTNSLGEAFRTDSIKKKYLPNTVEMQQRNINNQRYLQFVDNLHDEYMAGVNHRYRMEEIRTKNKGSSKDGPLKEFKTSVGDVKPVEITRETFKEKKIDPYKAEQESSFKELVEYIKTKFPNITTTGELTISNIDEFMNAHNGKDPKDQDEELSLKYKAFKKATRELNYNLNKLEATTKKIRDQHKELFDYSSIDDTKVKDYKLEVYSGASERGKEEPVKNPPPISKRDLIRVVNGENVNGFTVKTVNTGYLKQNVGAFGTTPGWSETYSKEKKLFYNGKEVNIGNDRILGDMFRGVLNEYSDRISKLEDYYTQEITSRYYEDEGFNIPNRAPLDPKSEEDSRLKTLLNVTGGQDDKNGYRILLYDSTGEGIYVVPLDKEGNPDMSHAVSDEKLANMKKGQNAFSSKIETPMGYAYYLPNFFERPEGIGSDEEILFFKSNRSKIQDFTSLVGYKLAENGSGYMTSDKLDDGTLSLETLSGKDADITMEYGTYSGITYIVKVKGDKTQFSFKTPDEVSTFLSNR